LLSGLSYSKQETVRFLNCPNCSISRDFFAYAHKQRYLQIPIGVSYRILKSEFTPVVEAGLLNNLLVAGTTGDFLGVVSQKSFYLSGYLSRRLNYQANNFLAINIGYRRINRITSVFDSDINLKANSYSWGLVLTPSNF